jgi:hypothetical protein
MPTGKHVLRNAYIAINGTALSDHASSLEVEDEAEEVEFTGFSPNGYREFGQGLKDATVTVTFFQDYASGSVHAILRPLYESGGTFTLAVGPSASEAVSATNPRGTMISRLYSYGGLAGEVGEAATFDATFRNAGTAGLTFGTT